MVHRQLQSRLFTHQTNYDSGLSGCVWVSCGFEQVGRFFIFLINDINLALHQGRAVWCSDETLATIWSVAAVVITMVGESSQPNNSTALESNCSFLSSMNLYLLVAGVIGLLFNVFPWMVCYAKLRTMCGRSSRDVLLMSLVLVDFLTVCIPLPIYLSMNNNCSRTQQNSHIKRPSICEIFYLMFVWLKLAAMFIITTVNYTSYLAVTARGIYRSIGDRISSSLACSRFEQKHREKRNSSIVIANLVIGIAIVAFLIASLPYIGLGPEGITPWKATQPSKDILPTETNFTTTLFCSLEQISYPRQNKEYTFLFAVLMSSSACFLLQIVHNILSCFSCASYSVGDASSFTTTVRASRSFAFYNRRLGAERDFAKMICVLGLTFHLTWIPVMVSLNLSLPSARKRNRSR